MTHANVGSLLVFDPSKLHLVRAGRGARWAVAATTLMLAAHHACRAGKPWVPPACRLNPSPGPPGLQVKCGVDQVCNASKDAVVGIITERGELPSCQA